MKKVIFCAAMLLGSFAVKAQQSHLEETKVLFTPQIVKVEGGPNSSIYLKVPEGSEGDFHRDPVAFLKRNLDMSKLSGLFDENSESFSVTMRSKKGKLIANFNKEGVLLSTSQKFRNILLPHELLEKLYRDHKGWTMVRNKYVAKGNSQSVEKYAYNVRLEKGKLSKNILLKKQN